MSSALPAELAADAPAPPRRAATIRLVRVEPASESRSAFGGLLRRLRLAAGLSQEALAERAGLSARGVSDLERGARAVPRAETVRLLADALGLDAAGGPLSSPRPARSSPPAPAGRRSAAPLAPAGAADPARRPRAREVAAVRGPAAPTRRPPGDADRAGRRRQDPPGARGGRRRSADAFADGAVFVALAPIRDPDLVAADRRAGAGRARGRRPARWPTGCVDAPARARVCCWCSTTSSRSPRPRRSIAELLAACPRLTVLATSRARLRLRGERELPGRRRWRCPTVGRRRRDRRRAGGDRRRSRSSSSGRGRSTRTSP